MQTTFVMLKPNAVARGLVGNIIERFEQKGLTISAMKLINVTKEQAMAHYDCHKDKPFYEDLIVSIMEGPVVCLAISGEQAVELVRHMAGATDPLKACPGTIRGDFSSDMRLNIIHTADCEERAKYELSIYFSDDELITQVKDSDKWIFS